MADAWEFEADLEIRGEERFGYKGADREQRNWTEGSPLMHFLRFVV